MKPSTLKGCLETLIQIRRPAMIWGSPGVGKSDLVRQVAAGLGMDLRDVRAVLLDPVDLRGLPTVSNGLTAWAPPAFLPTNGSGLLFLDEVNAAAPIVQAACYQLTLDRALGEYQLPDGWTVVAAGNRETDRAVTSRMPSALANRLSHLDFEPDLDDWCRWALGAGIVPEVIAFLRFRPELLNAFDPKAASRAFPTPRSWERVSEILAAGPAVEIEHELFTGTVGEGAAAELIGFLRIYRQLPSPDAVLLAPEQADVPTDPAVLYALTGALIRKASDANFDRVVTYGNRLPPEFSVLLVRDAVTRVPGLQQTRAFQGWAATNTDVLI